jgi:hypothetical protein
MLHFQNSQAYFVLMTTRYGTLKNNYLFFFIKLMRFLENYLLWRQIENVFDIEAQEKECSLANASSGKVSRKFCVQDSFKIETATTTINTNQGQYQ